MNSEYGKARRRQDMFNGEAARSLPSVLPVFASSLSTFFPRLRCSKIRRQHIPCYPERLLPPFQRLAECVVLDLDAHWAVVANLVKRRHESGPVDVAQSRDARRVPLSWKGENAHFVQAVHVDAHVLGMEVEELMLELAERADGVHLLQD